MDINEFIDNLSEIKQEEVLPHQIILLITLSKIKKSGRISTDILILNI
jgi:hypothetical protein